MVVTLKELRPMEGGVVKSIGGNGPTRRRLMDMGITPGANITMRKVAPLGDPIEVKIRGYELSLRKSEASQVTVEKACRHKHAHAGHFGGRFGFGHGRERANTECGD